MYKCKIVLMPDVFYRVFKILNKDDDFKLLLLLLLLLLYAIIIIIIIVIIIIIIIVIVILVRISEEFGRKMFRILARRNQVKLSWPNRKIEATKPFFILSFIEDAALEERDGC